MTNRLGITFFRRIFGAVFISFGYILGFACISYSDVLDANSTDPISYGILGAILLMAGLILAPTVLYPCLYDRFPTWVNALPTKAVHSLKVLLGAR